MFGKSLAYSLYRYLYIIIDKKHAWLLPEVLTVLENSNIYFYSYIYSTRALQLFFFDTHVT